MKWILGAILAAVIAWYFANETLQYLGLAIVQNDKWKIMATGWHILAKLWPVVVIILLGAGIVTGLVLLFFSSKEKKQKDEYEKKLKENTEKIFADMCKAEAKTTHLYQENEQLKKSFNAKEKGYLSKIDHQHSTIQRLHKKIDTLKSSF